MQIQVCSFLPFELVIGSWGERGAFDDLAHLLPAEAEVVDGPHIGELNHFDLDKHKHTRR